MAKKKEENATVNTQEIKTKFQQKMGELLEEKAQYLRVPGNQ